MRLSLHFPTLLQLFAPHFLASALLATRQGCVVLRPVSLIGMACTIGMDRLLMAVS